MRTNDHCQPNLLASNTVTGAAITPTLVPELKMPVASARSFCGNHMATALIEAGKLAASATPRQKRTTTKPMTEATRPCAAAASDQTMSAIARLFLTPNLSMNTPTIEGNAAYAPTKANTIQ